MVAARIKEQDLFTAVFYLTSSKKITKVIRKYRNKKTRSEQPAKSKDLLKIDSVTASEIKY